MSLLNDPSTASPQTRPLFSTAPSPVAVPPVAPADVAEVTARTEPTPPPREPLEERAPGWVARTEYVPDLTGADVVAASAIDPQHLVVDLRDDVESPAMYWARNGVPVVLDPLAVATRSVQVLIGHASAAGLIARKAVELSMELDHSAGIDVVVPRAIDLVLRRARQLTAAGTAATAVDHYPERLDLWRRLSLRSGLEPAAVVLALAPFPHLSVAAMLRVPVEAVESAMDRWYAGLDPDRVVPTDPAPLVGSAQIPR